MGNGKNIKIGVDPIAVLDSDFTLLEDLRVYLEDYGISSLADAHYCGIDHIAQQYWLTAEELDLDGDWKVLWTNYIEGLSHGCIRLCNRLDSLVWMFHRRSGQITARSTYEYIASSHCHDIPEKILVIIWKFKLPLKVICFVWLCLSNQINTWDNMLKKGWTGPSCCCLCMGDAESVNHLFVDCRFTREVIGGLGIALQ